MVWQLIYATAHHIMYMNLMYEAWCYPHHTTENAFSILCLLVLDHEGVVVVDVLTLFREEQIDQRAHIVALQPVDAALHPYRVDHNACIGQVEADDGGQRRPKVESKFQFLVEGEEVEEASP